MITGTAPSGLRYAVERSGRAAACCALSISCGTRSEKGFPAGTAHFTEHAIFRGTKRHSASYISSCLDRLGGELNAYTTKEEIVIHATVLKEDIGKAAGLLFELATEPTFPDADIETERVMQRINWISVCGNIAPSLGLLGTVQGMIMAFEGLATGSPDVGALALAISQALWTTAGGLVVSIPSVTVFYAVRNSANRLILRMQALTFELVKDLRHVEVVE